MVVRAWGKQGRAVGGGEVQVAQMVAQAGNKGGGGDVVAARHPTASCRSSQPLFRLHVLRALHGFKYTDQHIAFILAVR
jgi:hypothetical protein